MPAKKKSKSKQIAVKVYFDTKSQVAQVRTAAKVTRKKLSRFLMDAALDKAESVELKTAQITKGSAA